MEKKLELIWCAGITIFILWKSNFFKFRWVMFKRDMPNRKMIEIFQETRYMDIEEERTFRKSLFSKIDRIQNDLKKVEEYTKNDHKHKRSLLDEIEKKLNNNGRG